jgi:4-amino-4-deoxy-L-arabinose transferase-like glycosyltransferase
LLFYILGILSLWYILSLQSVPFHPDESSYRYMSRNIDQLLKSPKLAFYDSGIPIDLPMHYRLVDPPLGRFLTWFGLKMAGDTAPNKDWDWGKSWTENLNGGALPSDKELFALRFPTVLLLSLSFFLFYRVTQIFQFSAARWISVLLYALSPLVLLHGRRAMSEGVMFFSIVLTVYSLICQPKYSWLAAIPIALAFNSKQSTLPLVGVFFLLQLLIHYKRRSIASLVKHLLLFIILFLAITYLINPFMWLHPFDAIKAAILERQYLVSSQIEMLKVTSPEKYLGTPLLRGISLVINLFFTNPATADVANYLNNTQAMDTSYLANPINSLFRGLVPGVIYLIVFIFATLVIIINIKKLCLDEQKFALITISGFLLLFIALSVAVPIPYQRYCLPLLPFMILIIGQGLDILLRIKAEFKKRIPPN